MSAVKPPTWFKIVCALCLVWNLFGVMAYLMEATMSPEALAEMSEAQRAFYENRPYWATSAFAIAVFGGVAGCVLLMMRKAVAFPVLLVSLLGIVVQNVYSFIPGDALNLFGPAALGLPLFVFAVGIFLLWLAHSGKDKGWLS